MATTTLQGHGYADASGAIVGLGEATDGATILTVKDSGVIKEGNTWCYYFIHT